MSSFFRSTCWYSLSEEDREKSKEWYYLCAFQHFQWLNNVFSIVSLTYTPIQITFLFPPPSFFAFLIYALTYKQTYRYYQRLNNSTEHWHIVRKSYNIGIIVSTLALFLVLHLISHSFFSIYVFVLSTALLYSDDDDGYGDGFVYCADLYTSKKKEAKKNGFRNKNDKR